MLAILFYNFREKLIHSNAIFNENGTLTYTANRTTIFLPELNTIDLNETLVMPNLGVLVSPIDKLVGDFNFSVLQMVPVYFFEAPFFTKLGINMMMRSLKSEPFVNTTVFKYLWNETDPMIKFSNNLAPSIVPTQNIGILDRVSFTE